MILSKGDHRARAIRAYLYRTHGCPVSTVTLCSRGESDMSLLAGNPLRKIKTFFVCLCFAIQWQLYQHHFEVVLQKAGREQGLLECLLGQTEQQHTAYLQSLHFSCFILNNYFFFFSPLQYLLRSHSYYFHNYCICKGRETRPHCSAHAFLQMQGQR